MDLPCKLRDDGLDLYVRLTPKSLKDELGGVEASADGKIYARARVRAVPEKGAANVALEKLLAKTLKVPVSNVNLVAGSTARLKTVRIQGDAQDLQQKLKQALSE
ncbi:DUF167 family protein [Aquamicrobium segne]|uniref:UPF0235 protein ACFPLB_15610 n=1 Tax=Aquamicrobium segne TaxID=469547 RepID=A0ABW0H1V9_9HYPH